MSVISFLLVTVFYVLIVKTGSFKSSFSRIQNTRRGSLQMNIFDRTFRIITSNVNNVLKGLEDPEKVIEQAVIDMQNDLVKIRQSYAEISASQKKMEKQRDTAQANAAEWYRRAQLALDRNDEELAREALSRRQIQIEAAEVLDKQMETQDAAIKKLYSSMSELEAKITEAKRQKETFVARARTAKTSVKVNDMLSSISTSSSMEAFERMKEKVESLEAQAEVAGELAASNRGTTTSLEEKFKQLDSGSKVDDELEKLKRGLPSGKGNKLAPELPASGMSAADLDYERLRKELRGER
jgi:phage shock protein A